MRNPFSIDFRIIAKCMCVMERILFHLALKFMLTIICERTQLWIAIDTLRKQSCVRLLCSIFSLSCFLSLVFYIRHVHYVIGNLNTNDIILDLYHIANDVMDWKSKFETSHLCMFGIYMYIWIADSAMRKHKRNITFDIPYTIATGFVSVLFYSL